MNPLSQLEDIQLPQAVSIWPLAPAYWLLICVAVIFLCLISWIIYKRFKSREERRFIRGLIQQIDTLDGSAPDFLSRVQKALKLAANQKCKQSPYVTSSNQAVMAQTGEEWKAVLARSKFINKEPAALEVLFNVHKGVYDPSVAQINHGTIKRYAATWIKSDWIAQERQK